MRKRIILTAIIVLTILLLSGMVACSDQPAEEGENAAVDNVSVDHAHTYGEWSIVTPATCMTAGTRRRSCTLCGNIETEEIAALGHNFVGVTCTRCGLTIRETMGLSFVLKEDHTYTLTGYTGTDTDVVVLTTHSGIAVTSIADNAFKGNATIKTVIIAGSSNAALSIGEGVFSDCTALTSVSLPANVISMGNIFSGCTALENIFVDENNSEYTSVNGVLFTKDKTKLLKYPESKMDTTFVFPEETTTIEDNAYYDSPLTKVSITTSQCAFVKSSSKIEEVIITKGNTIPGDALSSRSHLTSVTIGNSVTSIGYDAFYNCSSLTSITIPDSVTSIGEHAFEDCNSLTSVTIGSGVTSIGYDAFENCSSLMSVYYTGDIASWCGISFGGSYANPLEYAHNLYINNTLVTEITIPDTVTEIKNYAFYGWNGTSITIPDSVTSIGNYAFYNCSSLTSITIPDSVTSIGVYAFTSCYKLVEVYDKSTLNITKGSESYGYVGYYAKAIYTEPYESKISTDENGYILYTDGDNISLIGYNGTETQLILSEGITEINQHAFYGNRAITSITIPDSVTNIGEGAFSSCSGLTSITIPGSVTSIGEYAFYRCSGLTSITIPGSVTSIGWNAFYGCYKLVEVYNKSSLNITKGSSDYGSVGYYAKAIYTEPYESKLSTDENGYILYTDGNDISLIGYTGANTILTLPSGITEINQYAFYDNNTITSITIPDSVTSIGDAAFYKCSSLTSVYYTGDIASWCRISFDSNYANPLSKAHNLYINNTLVTEITIPNTVTEIKEYAFAGWNGTSITIGNSVTSIGEKAFYDCSSLTSITIPDSVTSIGFYAFSTGIRLISITFEGTKAQWNAISKNNSWASRTITYIHCTDGDISK